MPQVGQRMYVVHWRDGQPHVVGGKVVGVGRKASPSRVRLDNGDGTIPVKEAAETIPGALHDNIVALANATLRPLFGDPLKPWGLARCLAKLTRLRRKLERHGLWRLA